MMKMSEDLWFLVKEASRLYFVSFLSQIEAILQLLYFDVPKVMANEDELVDKITSRRFHSNYMAHTLRDVI